MTQGAAGEHSPAGAAGEIPATRSSLRCASPRLCCLPGCPSRPHRPHPLPRPLPLRLGPRHRRCRRLRHSRRRFPRRHPLRRRRLRCSRHHRRPPQLSLAHLPHTTTALRASPHAASAPPRPHDDLPPRPPRVSDLWPCSARGDSAPPSRALLPAQPPGDATAASGRDSLSSAGWGRRRRSAGGGRAAGRPAARLDSNYGPVLGRAAEGLCGARRGRRARRAGGGEASQSGRWLAEGVGRVRGGTQAAGTGRGGPCGVREGPFVRPGSHPAGGHRGRNWQRLGLCVGWSRWGIWCLFMVLISPTHHSQPAGPHGAILKASAIAQVPNHVLVRAGRARSPPPRVRCSD